MPNTDAANYASDPGSGLCGYYQPFTNPNSWSNEIRGVNEAKNAMARQNSLSSGATIMPVQATRAANTPRYDSPFIPLSDQRKPRGKIANSGPSNLKPEALSTPPSYLPNSAEDTLNEDGKCPYPDCQYQAKDARLDYRKSNCRRHIRERHERSKGHSCHFEGCEKTYRRSDGLVRHVRKKHQ